MPIPSRGATPLPLDQTPDRASPAPDLGGVTVVPVAAAQPGGAAVPPLCILLAEDNPTNQLIARRMLERVGHRVHLACNGLEALEAVRHQRFDAILMDMVMPEMDGVAASRAIRSETAGQEVPIVAITANASAQDRTACLEAGMSSFLAKPFNRTTLLAVLAEATQPSVYEAPIREASQMDPLSHLGPVFPVAPVPQHASASQHAQVSRHAPVSQHAQVSTLGPVSQLGSVSHLDPIAQDGPASLPGLATDQPVLAFRDVAVAHRWMRWPNPP